MVNSFKTDRKKHYITKYLNTFDLSSYNDSLDVSYEYWSDNNFDICDSNSPTFETVNLKFQKGIGFNLSYYIWDKFHFMTKNNNCVTFSI